MAASKSPQLRLLHIRDEIDGVSAAVKGVSFYAYQQSYTLRRAAERAVQMLARYPEAPWSAIVGIGNVLRHEYQKKTISGFGISSRCICRNYVRSSCS